jgi:hypothetical protein
VKCTRSFTVSPILHTDEDLTLLGAVDTITRRERQFADYAMALAGVADHSPSR